MGGISSLAAGGSFFEGLEDGAFMGALTGALFGGIGGAGEALGALGKLGTTCEALGRLEKLAKISGTISLGMGTFDLLAWGAGLFAPENAFWKSTNASKGAKPISEWCGHSKYGVISDEVRKELIRRDEIARIAVKKAILERLNNENK